jgi:hypothetical protein
VADTWLIKSLLGQLGGGKHVSRVLTRTLLVDQEGPTASLRYEYHILGRIQANSELANTIWDTVCKIKCNLPSQSLIWH